ncbi:MAG: hypothetical protein PVJ28_00135 [Acidimicrobiia bacterium]|jgi:hypothetical protein
MTDEDLTMAEMGRLLRDVDEIVRGMRSDISEIRTSLDDRGMSTGVAWAALGMGAAALVTSGVGTVVAVLSR